MIFQLLNSTYFRVLAVEILLIENVKFEQNIMFVVSTEVF